jgi:drug/metabolite transporter (DMT)-like permease
VETVKAAEPITSAAVAVGWGIETLGSREVASLLAIVSGVLLSTWGNAQGDAR